MARVGKDGAFVVKVPAAGWVYDLHLRPARALPPMRRGPPPPGGHVGGAGGVRLEPDTLQTFRVQLIERAVPEPGATVHVRHYENQDGYLTFDVPPGATAFDVEGAEPGVLYSVMIGPTENSDYAFAQGRPTANEPLHATWEHGWTTHGEVVSQDVIAPGSLRLLLKAGMGFELERPLAAPAEFEVRGLMNRTAWVIGARARTTSGVTLFCESVDARLTPLRLELRPVKTPASAER